MSTAICPNHHEVAQERFLLASFRLPMRFALAVAPSRKRRRREWNTLADWQRRPKSRPGQTIQQSRLVRLAS